MVARTGDYMGTEINSDRQLWSVAGNLATVYRVLLGMRFMPDGIQFKPFIPKAYAGQRTLSNFKYRQSVLSITIIGYGNKISEFQIDGKTMEQAFLPASLEGAHNVLIRMSNKSLPAVKINLVDNTFAPETPVVFKSASTLSWEKVQGAETYLVYKNGKKVTEVKDPQYNIDTTHSLKEYQVLALDAKGNASFLSEPVIAIDQALIVTTEAELFSTKSAKLYSGYSGIGYLVINKKKKQNVRIPVMVPKDNQYSIDFRYANGEGPINTNNKCAIRSLYVDGKRLGAVVLPQRGNQNWEDWGYSNPLHLNLSKGRYFFELRFEDSNENMNHIINRSNIDNIRIIPLK